MIRSGVGRLVPRVSIVRWDSSRFGVCLCGAVLGLGTPRGAFLGENPRCLTPFPPPPPADPADPADPSLPMLGAPRLTLHHPEVASRAPHSTPCDEYTYRTYARTYPHTWVYDNECRQCQMMCEVVQKYECVIAMRMLCNVA